MEEFLTVKDVARILKKKPKCIREKCRRQELPGQKLPGSKDWIFDPEKLRIFLSQN